MELSHSIHTSGRASFKACRRRWDWVFRDRYYPKTTPNYFEFGTAYHAALEVYYNPATWSWVKNPYKRPAVIALAIAKFKDVSAAQREKYLDFFGNIDPAMEEDFTARHELGVGMLKYHLTEIAPKEDLPRGLTPIKVEIPFEIPILGPDGTGLLCYCDNCYEQWIVTDEAQTSLRECNEHMRAKGYTPCEGPDHFASIGLPVTFGGRIDALFQDAELRYWIADWKTAGKLHGDNDLFLELDDQITGYCAALDFLGVEVAGFIYHAQRKAFPEPPEPHKSGRRYKGMLFSTNKQQATTYELYLETVMENDAEGYAAGAYDEYLAYLQANPPRYHERYQIHRNKTELEQSRYNLWLEAQDIIDPKLRIYPNPRYFGCNTCAYRNPCIGKNQGEDYVYTLDTLYEKRRIDYWAEKVPSTESKGGE